MEVSYIVMYLVYVEWMVNLIRSDYEIDWICITIQLSSLGKNRFFVQDFVFPQQ